jgi:hypothetical protein
MDRLETFVTVRRDRIRASAGDDLAETWRVNRSPSTVVEESTPCEFWW